VRRQVIIFLSLAVGLLYLLGNHTKEFQPFPFSDVLITPESYLWILFGHIGVVLLALVIMELEPSYIWCARVLLVIEIIDTLNFVLTYSTDFLTAPIPFLDIPLTFNIIKVTVFGLALVIEGNKNNWS
jgi:hypothetical protein